MMIQRHWHIFALPVHVRPVHTPIRVHPPIHPSIRPSIHLSRSPLLLLGARRANPQPLARPGLATTPNLYQWDCLSGSAHWHRRDRGQPVRDGLRLISSNVYHWQPGAMSVALASQRAYRASQPEPAYLASHRHVQSHSPARPQAPAPRRQGRGEVRASPNETHGHCQWHSRCQWWQWCWWVVVPVAPTWY